MAASYCLLLTVALPWKDDLAVFQPTPLSCLWKDQVVEAGTTSTDFTVSIYLSADSQERMNRWKEFLDCHITRHHPRRKLK